MNVQLTNHNQVYYTHGVFIELLETRALQNNTFMPCYMNSNNLVTK